MREALEVQPRDEAQAPSARAEVARAPPVQAGDRLAQLGVLVREQALALQRRAPRRQLPRWESVPRKP